MDNKLLDNSQPETKNENITNDNDEEIKIQNLGEIEETIKKEVNEENATQNKTKKRKRKYGIDILRIVSMYLICLLHVLGAGGVLSGGIPQTANYFIAWFLEITAYCGVDCYALISGYIGIEGKYKYSNIIYLWLQVEFYSLIIFLIFQIINKDFDSDKFKENALPVTYERWWYFTAYVGLFSVKPYLDYALNNIPKNVAKWNILFGLIYIMIFARLNENLLYLGAGYTTYWLIILYIVGGYIKKYEPFKKINKIWLIIIWILLIVITWVIKLGIEISSKNNPENNGVADSGDKYISYLSVTIFGTGIIMLELFSRIDLEGKNKKLIKIIDRKSTRLNSSH